MIPSTRRVLFSALLLLAGCATTAQRQVQVTAQTIQQATAAMKACVQAVQNKPEYASLLPHTPDFATGQFTMAQLTDENQPTSDDARLLAAKHDELIPCRNQFITAISKVRPDAVPIMTAWWISNDQVLVRLIERKMTWAEAFREQQAVAVQAKKSS